MFLNNGRTYSREHPSQHGYLPVGFHDHGAVPGAGGGEGRGQAAGARALVAVAHEAATR